MKISFALVFMIVSLPMYSCAPKSNERKAQKKTASSMINDSIPAAMYVGTYTRDEGHVNGKADGIYLVAINPENGQLNVSGTVADIVNPSFLATSPDGEHLYSVSERTGRNGETGLIYAFEKKDDFSLEEIDQAPTNGLAPAHISVDETGKFVFTANYMGGVVMVYERMKDGSLEMRQQLNHSGSGPHSRQESSHPHMVKVSPDNEYLFVPDLGSDKIWSYRIDHTSAKVLENEPAFFQVQPGAGPRHMDFHPSGRFAYALNELNNTVNVFAYDSTDGSLSELQAVTTLPRDFMGDNTAADIHVHPNGKFLYASNRGHNSIAKYEINEESGKLILRDHTSARGEVPRNFAIDPTGRFLYVANQNSDTIVQFDIEEDTGELSYSGHTLEINTPACILFAE